MIRLILITVLVLLNPTLSLADRSSFKPQSTLAIYSEPGGAKVLVNGKLSGTTPVKSGQFLALKRDAGNYSIEVVMEGNPPLRISKNIQLLADEIQPVHFQLSNNTHPATTEAPKSVIDNSGIEMVKIPEGCFQMGSPDDESERSKDEGPQHRVCVAAFEMGKYEVTFDEWDVCVAAGGCTHAPDDKGWGRGKHPVINVSWEDIQQYLGWLNRTTGKNYRLSSEAEWEYAARSGTSTPFYTGNCISAVVANYDGTKDYNDCGTTSIYLIKTQPVGSYPANPWGLYDMAGNVWEWTEDCWHDNYQGAPEDGSAWVGGNCSYRVLRGGSWYFSGKYARSAYRSGIHPAYRHFNGFRLALSR